MRRPVTAPRKAPSRDRAARRRQPALRREDAVVLPVDHQVGLVVGSRYPGPETLKRNTFGLVGAADVLNMPLIATTTLEEVFGPLFPELSEAVTSKSIERINIGPFDDPRIVVPDPMNRWVFMNTVS